MKLLDDHLISIYALTWVHALHVYSFHIYIFTSYMSRRHGGFGLSLSQINALHVILKLVRYWLNNSTQKRLRNKYAYFTEVT